MNFVCLHAFNIVPVELAVTGQSMDILTNPFCQKKENRTMVMWTFRIRLNFGLYNNRLTPTKNTKMKCTGHLLKLSD